MIDTILTDAIKRIEFAIKTNPEDYTDIYTELRELMFVIRTFRDFISNPTLERLENLEREMMAPTVINSQGIGTGCDCVKIY